MKVAALLTALVYVALLLACGAAEVADPALVSRGRELYSEQGCTACHGREGGGGKSAPSLHGVHRHWRAEELVKFLADPREYKESRSRLRNLARRYPAEMPPFVSAGEERLRALAAYVLSL